MSESAPPRWVDGLFPVPTPPALATLVDIAWQQTTEDGYYDYGLLVTYYDFMFDLAAVPRPPAGWACYPEFGDQDDGRRDMPMFATPEFIPFGSLGDGGYVGWAVPAPELASI